MFRHYLFAMATLCLSVGGLRNASADILASADFSNYSDGPLVGQNGWVQFSSSSTNPLTVRGGAVSWAGGSNSDHQDALLAFATTVGQPTSGTQSYNFDLSLQITRVHVGLDPSVFASLQQSANPNVSNPVVQLWVRSEGTGFVFGTRIDNSSPFAFGSQALQFNQTYALRATVNMVPGNGNDVVDLWVGSSFNNLSLQATTVPTGNSTDPQIAAMRLAQLATSTVSDPGVNVFSMRFSSVPEPSSMALMMVAGSVAGIACRRRLRSAVQ